MPSSTSSAPGKSEPPGSIGARPALDAGLDAYERGDWKAARGLLRDATEQDSRKQNRLRAAELLASLSLDRFALALAAVLAAVLLAVFLLAVR